MSSTRNTALADRAVGTAETLHTASASKAGSAPRRAIFAGGLGRAINPVELAPDSG